MSVFLVCILCPAQHPVAGTPFEYASPHPPEAWLETICRDFKRSMRVADAKVPLVCPACGCILRAGDQWFVEVSEMKADSMSEAHAALSQITERELTIQL